MAQLQPNDIIEGLRVMLLVGLALTALLYYVLQRGDAEVNWHRRYLDEHPSLRHDFHVWRRRRHRELSMAAGRCPEHEAALDASGRCALCQGPPPR